MLKVKLIVMLVKFIMGAIALGIGIWYLSSSIGGASLGYSSARDFMVAIGAESGNLADVRGCFLCKYIGDLFGVLGNATEEFWKLLIDNLWIIMAFGFGIFVLIYSTQYLLDAMKQTAKLDTSEKKLVLKTWFDKVWKQGMRVMFAGAFLGALGIGGTTALKTITNITITPVMYVGSQFAALATGAISGASCQTTTATENDSQDILNPVLQPFQCVMGALNTVILAGAAGGFALMNYSWLGLGGGLITWLAGLAVVIMFLLVGFDLVFKVLSIVFKLIFLIIFVPVFIAAYAFEPVWGATKGLLDKAVGMLVKSAVQIVAVALKTVILLATVSYAADAYFPGPTDCYSSVFPPLLTCEVENADTMTLSIMNTFDECESVAKQNNNNQVDKDVFVACFKEKRSQIEAIYPDAFGFMDDGWGFTMLMIGVFVLYFFAIKPKIDSILGADSEEQFDFGGWVKNAGKTIWNIPKKLTETIAKTVTE